MTRLVAALLFVTLLPAPAHAALLPADFIDAWAQLPATVTVEPGDTLGELAADWPGGPFRAAYVNGLASPDLILVGQRLKVPTTDGARWAPRPTQGASRSWTPGSSSSSAPPATPSDTGGRYSSTGGDVWTALAECESGNTNAVTGNGFYGYFQFHPDTFGSLGYEGLPSDHPYGVQLGAAQRLQASQGWSPWPGCASRLGLL